jgi:ABC-2 type transport system permease protein
MALPVTYWIDLMRRALMAPGRPAFSQAAAWSNTDMFGVFAALTAVWAGAALLAFRACDHRARERGLIDTTSNY